MEVPAVDNPKSIRVERNKKIGTFTCELCNLHAPYEYFGNSPPFTKSVLLLEDVFVMRDPFTTERKLLILGSHCSLCNKVICVGQSCSLFYTKRFCLPCAFDNIQEFPTEIQQELVKKSSKDT
ncbi:cysteine-rich DPF motif domain-containing protein 1-like [Ptychodera flava]|uniref:cysteine-rich DPF motif domain-containing protein 1-like n=1 Tax=Ptychodera flava TaxID=63121 RepID=UPI00396A0931